MAIAIAVGLVRWDRRPGRITAVVVETIAELRGPWIDDRVGAVTIRSRAAGTGGTPRRAEAVAVGVQAYDLCTMAGGDGATAGTVRTHGLDPIVIGQTGEARVGVRGPGKARDR